MTWKRSDVAENQLLYVCKLLRDRVVVDTDPKIKQKHAQQPINLSAFQHQRGINVFRKLHPQTAAAGILMLLVRVENCAKYAALHDQRPKLVVTQRNSHQEPSHVGGREAALRSQQLGGNTPDNPRSKAGKKTISSAPASINVETERRKRKTLVWQMSPGPTPCPAATLQVSISEHLRWQHNRHKAEWNLKRTCVLQEKHCPRTASCVSARSSCRRTKCSK